MIERRSFLKASLTVAATLSLPAPLRAALRPKRILILGGTNYVGPHIVHSALRAGHDVTLFNRGLTNVHLFPDVEKLRGDRTRSDGLMALGARREWDWVVDTWMKAPRAVETSAALLRERVERYAYVSSIAVYGGFTKVGLTENDPILSLDRRPQGDGDEVGYVWAKRLGEASVTGHFPETALVVRGSSIFGFDFSARADNQNLYWPIRIRAGGKVLAPGDGNDVLQYTDVGAIADFLIDNLARGSVGAFNVAERPVRFREFLETARAVAGSEAELVWVPQDFLVRSGGTPFENVPLWIPADDPEPGFFRFDTTRARAAGLRSCPLEKTLSAVLTAYVRTPRNWHPDWTTVGGMPVELEERILKAWSERGA